MPTDGTPVAARIKDELSRVQVETLERNCEEFGIPVYSLGSDRQGIVHVIGPELGRHAAGHDDRLRRQPHRDARRVRRAGLRDRHERGRARARDAVPGAAQAASSMRIRYEGELGFGVTAKDLILATIGQIGVAGGVGHVVEYAGPAIEALSMEGRMTICNMTIEGGGRAGMIAPDETTFEWVEGRPAAPRGAELETRSSTGATCAPTRARRFDSEVDGRRRRDQPDGHVGHEPGDGRRRRRRGARPAGRRRSSARSTTWASRPGRRSRRSRSTASSSARARTRGSATCASRPRSSRAARSHSDVYAMVVPGSVQVKRQAEDEGLDEVFRAAGFDWRGAGCSMCLGMNPDILKPGERCASTSNRNFEGRQGRGGRTHLVSPQMAAAAAIEGRFVDIREWS